MTLFHKNGTNRIVLFQTHLLFVTVYGHYGHLLTQDDADQLECVIGYMTSLYLAMGIHDDGSERPFFGHIIFSFSNQIGIRHPAHYIFLGIFLLIQRPLKCVTLCNDKAPVAF